MKRRHIIPILTVLLMALWGSPHKAAAQIFAVRANALAACTATLNLGVEVALTDRWSLEGALFWNPPAHGGSFHLVSCGAARRPLLVLRNAGRPLCGCATLACQLPRRPPHTPL